MLQAVANVNGDIADAIEGLDALDERGVDFTHDRSGRDTGQGKVGANALWPCPWPMPRRWPTTRMPLFRSIGGPTRTPCPCRC